MGRGLFSGVIWGIVVAGLVLVVLALVGPAPERPGEAPLPRMAGRPDPAAPVAPAPEIAPEPLTAAPAPALTDTPEAQPATDIELPPGSEFNRPAPERDVTLPEAEAGPTAAPRIAAPEAAGDQAEAPLSVTEPVAPPAPEMAGPEGMSPPAEAEARPPALAAEDPVEARPAMGIPAAPQETPSSPEAPAAPAARTEPAPEKVAPPVPDPVDRAETDATTEPEEPEAPAPVEMTEAPEEAAPSPAVPRVPGPLPRIRPLPGTDPEAPAPAAPEAAPDTAEAAPEGALRLPAPSGAESPVPDVRIGRLPTVGGPAAAPEATEAGASDIPPQPPEGAGEAGTAEADPDPGTEPGTAARSAPETAPGLGALARNAIPFRTEDKLPLFSVILIDAGAAGLDREALLTFSFPVTFAVDPTRPDAAEAMAAYRDAGYEVVALATGLPQGAAPQDLEVALTAQGPVLDGAVAVLDADAGGFQDDRALTAQMVAFAGESGHGLVTYDRGLNAAARLAEQARVPQATVFRVLDADRPNAPTIRRMLDRAVFKARQDGRVVMVGHSYSDTVTALYSWALEAEAAEITLAPVSAVLRQR